MKTFHSLRESIYTTSAIFEIGINGNKKVYMRVDRSPYMNEERFVTVVDAKKFLHLWSLEPYNSNAELGKGNREAWVADRKYPEAEKGFSHGISNPVPIANVVCN